MPYILPALFAAGLGVGFWSGYSWQAAKVSGMEVDIASQKVLAKHILETATGRVLAAEQQAKESNTELEKAHESGIKTINAYHERLATVGLRDPGRKSCPVTLPKGPSAGTPTASADDGQKLSAITTGFLRGEARRADTLALYAKGCSEFVKSGCGVKE